MTNSHIGCHAWKGCELGSQWNIQGRLSASDLLSNLIPSLTRPRRVLQWFVVNDKTLISRDSDSIGLVRAWESVFLKDFLVILIHSQVSCASHSLGSSESLPREIEVLAGWTEGTSLGRRLECSEHPKGSWSKGENQALIIHIPTSSLVNYLSQEGCHSHKAELAEDPGSCLLQLAHSSQPCQSQQQVLLESLLNWTFSSLNWLIPQLENTAWL